MSEAEYQHVQDQRNIRQIAADKALAYLVERFLRVEEKTPEV